MYNKSLRRYIVLLCVITAALVALSVCACVTTKVKIATPNIYYRPYEAYWNECQGAQKYSVDISLIGEEGITENFYTTSTKCDLSGYRGKRISICVTAIPADGDKKYGRSDAARFIYNINDLTDIEKGAEEDAFNKYSSQYLSDLIICSYGKKTDEGEINTKDLKVYTGRGRLTANGVFANGFSTKHDVISGYSTIPYSYLQQFSAGAVVELTLQGSGGTRKCEIHICDSTVPEIVNGDNGVITYFKSLGGAANIKLGYSSYVTRIYADGDTNLSFTRSEDGECISIAEHALNDLSEGMHDICIYSGSGTIYGKLLIVDNYAKRLENIAVDIDNYPIIKLNWISGAEPNHYSVKIGGALYRSDDSEYSQLFNGSEMDISDLAKQGDRIELTAVFGDGSALNASVVVPAYEAFIPYLENKFEYIGQVYNRYIDSVDEWYAAIGHSILHYDSLDSGVILNKKIDLAVDILGYNASNIESRYKEGITNFRELVDYSCRITQTGNKQYSIELSVKTAVTPDKNYKSLSNKYTDLITPVFAEDTSAYLHYGDNSRGDNYDGFAINNVDKTAKASGSDELYFVIEAGYRPLIEDSNSPAAKMYAAAKNVLRRIIDDNMTDREKLHAITDYLNGEIAYDSAVAQLENELQGTSGYSAIYSYNCFFLEGVFDDGVAVCNGLSKALVVLCGIEGIPAVKIQGYTQLFPRKGRHAWNKVYLGGQWYGVDTTWGYVTDGGVRYAAHGYSFLSADALSATYHYQDDNVIGSDYYCGDKEYNLYANMLFSFDDRLCDHIVLSRSDLQNLFSYYVATYGGDKLIIYAYCNNILIAKSLSYTSDGYRVKALNGKGGEYIYILEKQ